MAVTPFSENIERLKDLTATFRSDLHVSRQTHGKDPVYVVHDPVSFQTHRLDTLQYTLAVALNGRLKLQDVFRQLVKKSALRTSDEPLFYDLVANLYKAGIVVLPIHRGKTFHEELQRLKKLQRKNGWVSWLFLRIPLSNPDLFLNRTGHCVNWLFSRWFSLIWIMAGIFALTVLSNRWSEFTEPLNGLLAPGNLPILWACFVVLKLWHELGHGYACKKFGGRVPEMGTILIVGNPLAYVDATAAWSFSERRKRLIVMCGGMYFESLVAIPAVFVWAVAGHGVIGSIAFQVVITASVVTLLFNANPLLKFDGYFILSELVRIPNLRSRADAQIKRTLKRVFLNISSGPVETTRNRWILLIYGVASSVYKIFLVLSIAMIIATRFPLVGILFGAMYVGSSLLGIAAKLWQYLLHHEETSVVRFRARLAAILVFVGLPVAVAVLPVPFDVVSWGVVGAERENVVRVKTPGEFQVAQMTPGNLVNEGSPLVQLANDRVVEEFHVASAGLQEAILKWTIARETDVVESARIEAEIQQLRLRVSEARRRIRELQIVAPNDGYVLRVHDERKRGQYLRIGEAVAMLVDGGPILRIWLTQEQLKNIVSDVGTIARFRVSGHAEQTYYGKLTSIKPAAESVITEHALTSIGGGDLMVDPKTNQPMDTLFQVEITPNTEEAVLDKHGRRVAVAFPRAYESISCWAFRKCRRLLQQLLLA